MDLNELRNRLVFELERISEHIGKVNNELAGCSCFNERIEKRDLIRFLEMEAESFLTCAWYIGIIDLDDKRILSKRYFS